MAAVTRVRLLVASDAPEVAALNAQLGYKADVGEIRGRLEHIATKPDHSVLGAEGREGLLGFVHFFERPSVEKGFDMVVQSLVVDERGRAGGVGRVLMEAVEAAAKSKCIASVALSSRVDRLDAHAFYAALGYEVAATSSVFVKTLA